MFSFSQVTSSLHSVAFVGVVIETIDIIASSFQLENVLPSCKHITTLLESHLISPTYQYFIDYSNLMLCLRISFDTYHCFC